MPGKTVDGNDAVVVAEAAQEYIDRARKGEGPALLEMVTYRWRGHYEGDPGTKYRTPEEVEEWKKRDPIPRLEKVLLDKGILTKEDSLRIQNEADAEVAEAEKFCEESPDPNPEEAPTLVYATSHT
jgi:TPP-dependent pyruvate/acetoin dehydrogenase alpha subunit